VRSRPFVVPLYPIKAALCLALASLAIATAGPIRAQQLDITTEAYDNNRSLANLNETILNTSNVNVATFGKLFSQPVDGAIYAQPLYLQGIQVNGATHNVVYVATMNDSVYAFDADSNTGTNSAPLWFDNFSNPPSIVAPLTGDGTIVTDSGQVGIESTPVIDLSSNTLYVVTLNTQAGAYVYQLHALNIFTGAEKFGGPVVIGGSVPGSGIGNVNGTVTFNANLHMQRPALALASGTVFVAFGSFGDQGTYFGWIMGYNATTLAQTSIVCTTPNADLGAVWMGGGGPVIDGSGNAYYMTGNGPFDGLTSFGDSLVKYSTTNGQLSLADWFAPDNFSYLAANDLDFGTTGPIMLTGTNLIAGVGKFGTLYLMNSGSLGHEQTGNGQILQSLAVGSSVFTGPAYYNRTTGAGPWLYVWPIAGYLKAYHFNGATLDATPASMSAFPAETNSFPASLAISANGSTTGSGILWAAMPSVANAYGTSAAAGVLYAFDAANLNTVLWNSNQNAVRDNLGIWSKFRSPVVANGKVYVGSLQNSVTEAPAALNVYGLMPPAPQSPTATASFLGTDATTQGSWQGVYGAQGYSLAASAQLLPSNVTFTPQNSGTWTWTASTTDPRALQVPAGGRIAAAWYSASPNFAIDLSDGQTHEISVYVLDWDGKGRSETIEIVDAGSGAILDSETALSFTNGEYFSWNVTGNVVVSIVGTGGPNAVLSGVFWGPAGSGTPTAGPSGTAAFNALDTATQGAWQGKYGSSGYDIVGIGSSVPSGTQFNVQNDNTWTWVASTSDLRALRLVGSQTTGTAAAWYNATGSTLTFTLSFTDSNTHQFALYTVDWDSKGRAETVEITDTAGQVLDMRNISSFSSGVYLSWDISGSVIVTISPTSGPNAVVSGIFLDPTGASGSPPPPTISVSWSWPALGGASSYNVYRGSSPSGPWTLLGSAATSSYTDSSVMAGQTYYYEVNSVTGGVESPYVTFSIITSKQ
jgi:hypothetical protein